MDRKENELEGCPVWKKKRAALEFHAKQMKQHSNEVKEQPQKAMTVMSVSRDKLLGALALMELSGVTVSADPLLESQADAIISNATSVRDEVTISII